MKRLLVISYRFPPEAYPLAIRIRYFLNHLERQGWTIDAITAAADAETTSARAIHRVPSVSPHRGFQILQQARLGKLVEYFVWPDRFVFWGLPAYWKARRLTQHYDYDAIACFMMPYSPGLVAWALKKQTGLPLVMNLNDSPTCSDMNPTHPTRLHYGLTRRLEDCYVRTADAAIYVSRRNMERVRERQPLSHWDTFHLIRRGAPMLPKRHKRDDNTFRLVYTGGTSGWYQLADTHSSPSLPKRLYHKWKQLGRYRTAQLDYRTHGPVFVGRAIRRIMDRRPEWQGNIQIDVYGERYPDDVVNAVLDRFNLHDLVHLHGRVPHEEALRHMTEGDLLFMALPNRVDGTPGSRISAKTYEYLMTDRPILAALPPGENREYLQDKPGVHLTAPDDIGAMARVIEECVSAAFNGNPVRVDRSNLQSKLTHTARAEAFEHILCAAIESTPSAP